MYVVHQHLGGTILSVSFFFLALCRFRVCSHSAGNSMSSRSSYDNTGKRYNVTRIINPDSSFNEAAYKAYSPLYLSYVPRWSAWYRYLTNRLPLLLCRATFAMAYGLSFASITATLTHAFLYYRKQIWTQSRRSMSEQPDIHARLMSVYPQVPEWWYAVIFGEAPQVIMTISFSLIQELLVRCSEHVCVWCRVH